MTTRKQDSGIKFKPRIDKLSGLQMTLTHYRDRCRICYLPLRNSLGRRPNRFVHIYKPFRQSNGRVVSFCQLMGSLMGVKIAHNPRVDFDSHLLCLPCSERLLQLNDQIEECCQQGSQLRTKYVKTARIAGVMNHPSAGVKPSSLAHDDENNEGDYVNEGDYEYGKSTISDQKRTDNTLLFPGQAINVQRHTTTCTDSDMCSSFNIVYDPSELLDAQVDRMHANQGSAGDGPHGHSSLISVFRPRSSSFDFGASGKERLASKPWSMWSPSNSGKRGSAYSIFSDLQSSSKKDHENGTFSLPIDKSLNISSNDDNTLSHCSQYVCQQTANKLASIDYAGHRPKFFNHYGHRSSARRSSSLHSSHKKRMRLIPVALKESKQRRRMPHSTCTAPKTRALHLRQPLRLENPDNMGTQPSTRGSDEHRGERDSHNIIQDISAEMGNLTFSASSPIADNPRSFSPSYRDDDHVGHLKYTTRTIAVGTTDSNAERPNRADAIHSPVPSFHKSPLRSINGSDSGNVFSGTGSLNPVVVAEHERYASPVPLNSFGEPVNLSESSSLLFKMLNDSHQRPATCSNDSAICSHNASRCACGSINNEMDSVNLLSGEISTFDGNENSNAVTNIKTRTGTRKRKPCNPEKRRANSQNILTSSTDLPLLQVRSKKTTISESPADYGNCFASEQKTNSGRGLGIGSVNDLKERHGLMNTGITPIFESNVSFRSRLASGARADCTMPRSHSSIGNDLTQQLTGQQSTFHTSEGRNGLMVLSNGMEINFANDVTDYSIPVVSTTQKGSEENQYCIQSSDGSVYVREMLGNRQNEGFQVYSTQEAHNARASSAIHGTYDPLIAIDDKVKEGCSLIDLSANSSPAMGCPMPDNNGRADQSIGTPLSPQSLEGVDNWESLKIPMTQKGDEIMPPSNSSSSHSPLLKAKLDPRKCEECGKLMFTYKQYILHRQKHSKCQEICWICASYTDDVRKHLTEMHSNDFMATRQYHCQQCRGSFDNYADLHAHAAEHFKSKPYECPICLKRFSQQGNLSCHLRIHSGVKPFICNICNKTFRHSNSLRRHLRTVHSSAKAAAAVSADTLHEGLPGQEGADNIVDAIAGIRSAITTVANSSSTFLGSMPDSSETGCALDLKCEPTDHPAINDMLIEMKTESFNANPLELSTALQHVKGEPKYHFSSNPELYDIEGCQDVFCYDLSTKGLYPSVANKDNNFADSHNKCLGIDLKCVKREMSAGSTCSEAGSQVDILKKECTFFHEQQPSAGDVSYNADNFSRAHKDCTSAKTGNTRPDDGMGDGLQTKRLSGQESSESSGGRSTFTTTDMFIESLMNAFTKASSNIARQTTDPYSNENGQAREEPYYPFSVCTVENNGNADVANDGGLRVPQDLPTNNRSKRIADVSDMHSSLPFEELSSRSGQSQAFTTSSDRSDYIHSSRPHSNSQGNTDIVNVDDLTVQPFGCKGMWGKQSAKVSNPDSPNITSSFFQQVDTMSNSPMFKVYANIYIISSTYGGVSRSQTEPVCSIPTTNFERMQSNGINAKPVARNIQKESISTSMPYASIISTSRMSDQDTVFDKCTRTNSTEDRDKMANKHKMQACSIDDNLSNKTGKYSTIINYENSNTESQLLETANLPIQSSAGTCLNEGNDTKPNCIAEINVHQCSLLHCIHQRMDLDTETDFRHPSDKTDNCDTQSDHAESSVDSDDPFIVKPSIVNGMYPQFNQHVNCREDQTARQTNQLYLQCSEISSNGKTDVNIDALTHESQLPAAISSQLPVSTISCSESTNKPVEQFPLCFHQHSHRHSVDKRRILTYFDGSSPQ